MQVRRKKQPIFNGIVLPVKCVIAGSATKFEDGTKTLVKEGKAELEVVSQQNGLKNFCAFIRNQMLDGRRFLFVNHSGIQFDYH